MTDKPTQELKPCAHCGGEANVVKVTACGRNNAGDQCFRAYCRDCQVRQHGYSHATPEAAIAAWNTRSGDTTELLREAREAISFCSGSCDKALVARIDAHLEGEA